VRALREAAGAMLGALRDDALVAPPDPLAQPLRPDNDGELDSDLRAVQIDRLTCEVQHGPQRELVSLRLQDGQLQVICSCGQPGCVHLRAVLQLTASVSSQRPGPAGATHASVERSALERAAHDLPAPAVAAQLGDALADVVTAVVRAGICSDRVASVRETLSRVERALPPPLPLGLSRWLGRIHEAIDTQDTVLAAYALSAAARLAEDLRSASSPAGASSRLASWFAGDAVERAQRLSDRTLVELAREWINGHVRNQIERRYLVDLDSGEFYREECVRGEAPSSVGSCPRLVGVSLAEVEAGVSPRRIRLLQYTTTPHLERGHWDTLAAWAQRDSQALLTAYRNAVIELGALAEPFALAAPRTLRTDPGPCLLLDRGSPLPLCEEHEPGVIKRCEQLMRQTAVAWVAGRLVERDGQMMLRPLAVGIQDATQLRCERL